MNTDRRIPKLSKTNTSQCYTVQHNSHMGWCGIELEPPQW